MFVLPWLFENSHLSPLPSAHIPCLPAMPLVQLMPFIIGRGGNTKKQLEQETGATLIIPKGGAWHLLQATPHACCVPMLHTAVVHCQQHLNCNCIVVCSQPSNPNQHSLVAV